MLGSEQCSGDTMNDLTSDAESKVEASEPTPAMAADEMRMMKEMAKHPEAMLAMLPESNEKAQMQEALKNPLFRQMITSDGVLDMFMRQMPEMPETKMP
jgi:hypothetical protein